MKPPRTLTEARAAIPTATLDTNVVRELWDERENASVVESLLKYAEHGQLDLAVTSRIEYDIPDPPLSKRINELPQIRVRIVASVVRVGYSRIGVDRIGSKRFLKVESTLRDQLIAEGRNKGNLPDWRDWDHLHGHYLEKRDVFLTFERAIRSIASELRSKLDIVVMHPGDFLSQLQQH